MFKKKKENESLIKLEKKKEVQYNKNTKIFEVNSLTKIWCYWNQTERLY